MDKPVKLHNLTLNKPIIFFDLEATGTNPQVDRIVEICVAKLFPDGRCEVKTKRVNPERAIPSEASEIHGIKDEDVANEPTFKQISAALNLYFEDSDIAGYNIIRYDIPLLIAEFQRAGLNFTTDGKRIIDAQNIFHKMEPRTLGAAVQFFCNKDHKDAHTAEADVLATIEVFDAQLMKYTQLPKEMNALHEFCNPRDPKWIDSTGKFKWDDNNEAIIAFGKNKGLKLRDIASQNPGFLAWMLKMSFPDDAKKIAKDAIAGKFPIQK